MPAVRVAVSLLVLIAAAPTGASPSPVSVEVGEIVLGRVSSAPVTVRVTEDAGTEHRPLRLAANVGTFAEATRVAPGLYRATYFPPATRFPQVALVAVWKETGPGARVEWFEIPLLGASRVPVRARRAAAVTVGMGSRVFGPVVADARGLALVPVAVPPGVDRATVRVQEGDEVTERALPIEAAPYNQVVAAVVPSAIAADGREFARLHVFHRAGDVDTHERLRVEPTEGSVRLEAASDGHCTYRYLPAQGTPATEVSFAISVAGDPASRASVRIALAYPPPARLFVMPPALALEPGSGARGVVSVQVTSADGLGLPDLSVAVTANGVPLEGPAAYRGDGRYELDLAAPAEAPPGNAVELRARAAGRSGVAIAGIATYHTAPPRSPPPAPRERWDPGRALLGARAGFTHALNDLSAPHAGVEGWAPLRVGETHLLAGVTATAAQVQRRISDPVTGVSSTVRVLIAPVALQLGAEVHSTRRLSLVVGAGAVAAYARARSDLASGASTALGFGGMGFASLGWALGPGQLFGQLSYGVVPVSSDDLRLEAGGVSLDVGFRVGVR